MARKLTLKQAIIITGYTGIMAVPDFSIIHADIEKRLGRPVWHHELANKAAQKEIKKNIKRIFYRLSLSDNHL